MKRWIAMSYRDFQVEESRRDGAIHQWSNARVLATRRGRSGIAETSLRS